MSILVDYEIRNLISSGEMVVGFFDPSLVNPASLDVRLGNTFTWVKGNNGLIDPLNRDSFTQYTEERSHYHLPPGGTVLASMLEFITLPSNVCAVLKGKSSLGRLNLGNSHVAGFIDNSWSGVLTMELINYSREDTIKLTAGMKIGQLVFYRTNTPNSGYDKTGRYQNQKPGMGSLGV